MCGIHFQCQKMVILNLNKTCMWLSSKWFGNQCSSGSYHYGLRSYFAELVETLSLNNNQLQQQRVQCEWKSTFFRHLILT